METPTTFEASGVLRPNDKDNEWQGFYFALYWLLGSDLPGRCSHTTKLAWMLLQARGYDAEASLALYADSGGHCDCEILLNTATRLWDDDESAIAR